MFRKFLELFSLRFLTFRSEWMFISCDQNKLRLGTRLKFLGTLSSWVFNHLVVTPYSLIIKFGYLHLNNKIWKWFLSWTSFSICLLVSSLTLAALSNLVSCIKINIYLNFYVHTSLWCLKRFYEGLQGLTKKGKNKNLS